MQSYTRLNAKINIDETHQAKASRLHPSFDFSACIDPGGWGRREKEDEDEEKALQPFTERKSRIPWNPLSSFSSPPPSPVCLGAHDLDLNSSSQAFHTSTSSCHLPNGFAVLPGTSPALFPTLQPLTWASSLNATPSFDRTHLQTLPTALTSNFFLRSSSNFHINRRSSSSRSRRRRR